MCPRLVTFLYLTLLVYPARMHTVRKCPYLMRDDGILGGECSIVPDEGICYQGYLAATLPSSTIHPFNQTFKCATLMFVYTDLHYDVTIDSDQPTADTFDFEYSTSNNLYQRYGSKEVPKTPDWFLYVNCVDDELTAMLGLSDKEVDEEESRRVLGPWLKDLNLSHVVSVDDFRYATGICKRKEFLKKVKEHMELALVLSIVLGFCGWELYSEFK